MIAAGFRDLLVASGTTDVKDAFHRLRMPMELLLFFCLGTLSGTELGLDETLEYELFWTSLPMGITWSLFFCQCIVSSRATQILGSRGSRPMSDRGAAPCLTLGPGTSKLHYVYVDNAGVLQTRVQEARDDLEALCDVLDKTGLTTHETEVRPSGGETLGIRIDGRVLATAVAPKRLARLRQAFKWALRRRALPGAAWEVLLGHLTHACLIERGLLSAFHSIYAFIRRHYDRAVPLWPSARDELRHAVAATVFSVSFWALEWSPHVGLSDSSLDGWGVCTGGWPTSEVAAHGRITERSRFRRRAGRSARDEYFESYEYVRGVGGLWELADGEPAPDGASSMWEEVSGFDSIPPGLLHKGRYRILGSGQWRIAENILVLEARAILRCFKSLISFYRLRDTRVLLLTDNMSCCLIFERRRSKNFQTLVLVRQLIALSMIFGINVYFRWIPSEVNVSDEPSRYHDQGRPASSPILSDESQEEVTDRPDSQLGPSVFSALRKALGVEPSRFSRYRNECDEVDADSCSGGSSESGGSFFTGRWSRSSGEGVEEDPYLVTGAELQGAAASPAVLRAADGLHAGFSGAP